MTIINFNERIPTERELKKTFGFSTYPDGGSDGCCGGGTHYLIDSITHRVLYHKQPLKEAIKEIEEILEEMGYKRNE